MIKYDTVVRACSPPASPFAATLQMMFTAVTDDGVSLGSERGSELMMDGADPACPLCNV